MGIFSTIRIAPNHLPKEYAPQGGYWQTKDIGYGGSLVIRAGKLKEYLSFCDGTYDQWAIWWEMPYHGTAEVYAQQEDGSFVCLDVEFYQGRFERITETYRGSMEGYWKWRTERIGVKPE